MFFWPIIPKCIYLLSSPNNSQSSTVSRQSTQEYSDGQMDMYENQSQSELPSPAQARWIEAFNKIRAQLSDVSLPMFSICDIYCVYLLFVINILGEFLECCMIWYKESCDFQEFSHTGYHFEGVTLNCIDLENNMVWYWWVLWYPQ